MSKYAIGLIGAGGHSREVASYAGTDISFRAVTAEYLSGDLVDVSAPNNQQRQTAVVVTIGSPLVRKLMVGQWPGDRFMNIIAKSAETYGNVVLGEGIQLAPRSVVMDGCVVGDHVIVNIGSPVSHDCTLGDYVTIAPGVRIGGGVAVGEGAYIGIGAVIRDHVTIAPGAVIGAGAVVVKDVDVENGVYVGCPAKHVRTNPDWLDEV